MIQLNLIQSFCDLDKLKNFLFSFSIIF